MSAADVSTQAIYDKAAGQWQRKEPVLLSDFTARPFLLQWCEPLAACDVLDLGCGEGYVTRQLVTRGAKQVLGIDISAEMVRQACDEEAREPLGIEYRQGDAGNLGMIEDASFDLVVAVFLFNYLGSQATRDVMKEVNRVLKPGGRFVFAVPHPSLPFLRPQEPPFYFERGQLGYFSAKDCVLEGRIWRRDGVSVPVRCVHKTLQDYFEALAASGFTSLPDIQELRVTDAHLAMDPAFFGPLRDQALHLAFRTRKAGVP